MTRYKLTLTLIFALFATNTWAVGNKNACQESQCKAYFKAFKRNAHEGKAEAMATLAELYYQGYGTKKNDRMALKYYRKAANKGVGRAQYKAALMYLQGDYKNVDLGILYLKKASVKGIRNSDYVLGMLYYSQKFGKHDLAEADKWLAKAYTRQHYAIPEFIAYIRSFEAITATNFPLLSVAMAKRPLIVNIDGQLSWNNTTEVITISSPSLEARLNAQLVALRFKNRALGSRLSGVSCKEKVGCSGLAGDAFSDPLGLVPPFISY